MGRRRVCLAVQTIRELNIEEKRVKAEERTKVGSKQPEEHSLVKSKHRKQNGGQKKIVLGGPKENEARKVSRFFSTYQPEKVQAVVSTRTKVEARNKKEMAKKVLILSPDDWFSSLTDDSSTSATGFEPCSLSVARCSGSWLLHTVNWIENGNQKVPEICVCIVTLRQNFVLARSPFCLLTLRQKLVGKLVLFTFRQHLHVLAELTCLRRATCLSCSPFLR